MERKRNPSTPQDGKFKLSDLVPFGQIGVKVILAIESAYGLNFGPDGTPKAKGESNRFPVQDRQRSGQASAYGTGKSVGGATKGGRAGAKKFALGF
jgi:hypothetical protein